MKKTLRFAALAAVTSLTLWLPMDSQAQTYAYCSDIVAHEDVLQLSELELFPDLRMLLRSVAMRRLPARRRPAVGNG